VQRHSARLLSTRVELDHVLPSSSRVVHEMYTYCRLGQHYARTSSTYHSFPACFASVSRRFETEGTRKLLQRTTWRVQERAYGLIFLFASADLNKTRNFIKYNNSDRQSCVLCTCPLLSRHLPNNFQVGFPHAVTRTHHCCVAFSAASFAAINSKMVLSPMSACTKSSS